jgi:hypothetical protein
MDQDFETSQTTQSRPVPPRPEVQRPQAGPEGHASDATREQIHDLSKPAAQDKTREQIHDLSKPAAQDKTREQIHEMSKPAEHDRTREQIHNLSKESDNDKTRESIRNLKDWTLSGALGLPILSGDKPAKRWTGSSDNKEIDTRSNPRSGWTFQDDPPRPFQPGQSPLAHFSRIDRWAYFGAAAMMLLPLIGADIFSR